MYFHNSPSLLHSHFECIHLLENINRFDVLRSDKSISSVGMEPRTPFLDKTFVSMFLSIPSKYRFRKVEKEIIRDSFKGYLPDEVLYRKKEAFSDGVSKEDKSWFSIIQDKLKDYKPKEINYDNLSLKTKEQKYYFDIFNNLYPSQKHIIPYYWMPKWSKTNDPSARTL